MNYLVNNYSIDKLQISKPKKHSEEYLICKIKYPESPDDFFIQFPKMKLVQLSPKSIELEFLPKETKYTKECYNFLSDIDSYISEYICTKSEEWFDKKIPMEKINEMYTKTLISNEFDNLETNTRIKINIKKKDIFFVDNKKNELELSDYKNNSTVECICRLKYILFSKDKCVPVWEMVIMKLILKVNKVPKNAFIEEDNSDNESIEEYSFF